MSVEDRVRTAAEATAASVRQIPPLTLPETSAVSAERHKHRGWLIPLSAAAAVAALALSLVTLRHAEAPRPAPPKADTVAPSVAGIPRYYAIANEGPVSHIGQKAAITVTVGDVYTGKTVATAALPAVGVTVGVNSAIGVSAAGDDRTFVVGRENLYSGTTYFLVHFTPGAKQVATVEKLPIPEENLGVLVGFAVSPNGKELAVLSVRGNGTTLRVYSVKSGATLRTWVGGAWRTSYSVYQEGINVSWTADNRQVAFSTVVVATAGGNSAPTALQERLIGVTEPSGDLAVASKVVLNAPGNCSSLLLTPDGRTVVCGTKVSYPPVTSATGCGSDEPMFVAYSAATGKRLRVLSNYTGDCTWLMNTVLWSDDSARHVIGETRTKLQGNPDQYTDRYGVAAAGQFTKFQVAQHGQWYSAPAF
ncbi:MAG: hypothetical protein ACRDOI_03490 [Trebonia sp.]